MTEEAANSEEDLEVDITNSPRDHEQGKIEAWLDEHPEFFQEYLIRKGENFFGP